MLTRVGDEHMGRFVREALAAEGVDVDRGADRPASASPASCCSASRVRKASRTSSIARTAPTWGSSAGRRRRGAVCRREGARDHRHAPVHRRRARGVASRHRAREAARTRSCSTSTTGRCSGALPATAAAPTARKARPRSRGRCRPSCPTATSWSAPKRRSASPAAAASALEALRAIRARDRRDHRDEARRRRLRRVRRPDPGERRPGARRRRIPGRGAECPRRRRRLPVRIPERLDRGLPAAHCGRRGNAAGAIVVTRHGCTPAMPTRAELEEFLGRAATARAARRGRAHRRPAPRDDGTPDGGRPLHPRLRPSPPGGAARGRERRRLCANRGFQGAGRRSRARGRRRAASRCEPRRHRRRPPRRPGARAPQRAAAPGSGVPSNCPPRGRSSSRRRAASGSSSCIGRGTTSSSAS